MIATAVTTLNMMILCLGALVLGRDAGYAFDLRKHPRRMIGGRRASDRG